MSRSLRDWHHHDRRDILIYVAIRVVAVFAPDASNVGWPEIDAEPS